MSAVSPSLNRSSAWSYLVTGNSFSKVTWVNFKAADADSRIAPIRRLLRVAAIVVGFWLAWLIDWALSGRAARRKAAAADDLGSPSRGQEMKALGAGPSASPGNGPAVLGSPFSIRVSGAVVSDGGSQSSTSPGSTGARRALSAPMTPAPDEADGTGEDQFSFEAIDALAGTPGSQPQRPSAPLSSFNSPPAAAPAAGAPSTAVLSRQLTGLRRDLHLPPVASVPAPPADGLKPTEAEIDEPTEAEIDALLKDPNSVLGAPLSADLDPELAGPAAPSS